MSALFDEDSDNDEGLSTNNQYAKSYDSWRQKEELNKFKTKYGEEAFYENDESSSSSDDDEDAVELTQQLEKDFFKTLSSLKNKDPKIYDEKTRFFEEKPSSKTSKKPKESPIYINDYERKLILEKGGQISDSEDEHPRSHSPTYVEEQKELQSNLKNALNSIEDVDWNGLCSQREKSKEEKQKEENDYKEWLLGQKTNLDDKETENDLKPLKDYWTDPKLERSEKFLRDYILSKRFLEKDDENYVPTYDEIVHDSDEGLSEDEEALDKQDQFEHKYNYRFEEPDEEYIKRYPRTMGNTLRKTDDRRKIKRVEVKERKEKEKEEKMEELRKMRELKKKEIEEKLEKLKEITGNSDVPFENLDIDGDFDPEAHDKHMRTLFDEDFYQGAEDDRKPEFPELDEELEIERWDRLEDDGNKGTEMMRRSQVPHCEDEDFNMDCDFDPAAVKETEENSKNRRKRKRKSKFAEVVSEPKPVFDPNNKTYQEYLDEYYKLDCEDIIGDIPCRFKYRKVVPNSFGLTIEEILLAKDRELNRWCSLKKAVQQRPENVEKYDVVAYQQKAKNVQLKKKVLPSLFEETNEKETKMEAENKISVKKRKRNKKQTQIHDDKGFETNEVKKGVTETKDVQKKGKQKRKSCVKDINNVIEKNEVDNGDDAVSETNDVHENMIKNVKRNKKSSSKAVDKKIETDKVGYDSKTNEVQNGELKTNEVRESISRKSKRKSSIKTESNKIETNEGNNVDDDSKTKKVQNEELKTNEVRESISKKDKRKQKSSMKDVNKKIKTNEACDDSKTNEIQNRELKTNEVRESISKKSKRKRKSSTKDCNTIETNEDDIVKKQKMSVDGNKKKTVGKQKKSLKQKTRFKNKQNKSKTEANSVDISDARLAAYGIKPKRFKNKMKYCNKSM